MVAGAIGFLAYLAQGPEEEGPPSPLTEIGFPALALASEFPAYNFKAKSYDNPEYSLPLSELPENYQRDIVERFGQELTSAQKDLLLENGVIILAGQDYERFEKAYG